jgi:hypothetical protein
VGLAVAVVAVLLVPGGSVDERAPGHR